MTQSKQKAPLYYPKNHLLAASGVAALLSLILLVFPSSEVEAKRATLLPTESYSFFPEEEKLLSSEAELPELSLTAIKRTEPYWKTVPIKKGDTLSTVLGSIGVPNSLLLDMLTQEKTAKEFTQIRPGQNLEIRLSPENQFLALKLKKSNLETIQIDKTEEGFKFTRDVVQPDIHETYARGTINSSLFASGRNAGLSQELVMSLASLFKYDIDFALDLRKGDTFELIYEQHQVDGKQVSTGNILAARFTNKGKTYTAVKYTNKNGNSTYYRADGSSMRRAFIRTPVDFARISSRFSTGRRHPILNKIRAHKGVDYAAPTGTPIKATGDGRIVEIGRKGGYGNAIVLQHGQQYKTLYGHMSRFAKGLHRGASVKQGQLIGYVGMTGLATGPHLHYEFQVNGRHVDPLSAKLPMADPLAGTEKKRFMQQTAPLIARMDREQKTLLAMNKP